MAGVVHWVCLLVVTVFLVGKLSARKLPSFVPQCKRNDPELNACILRAVEVLRPNLKVGIPEMHIPATEPLRLTSASLDSGTSFNASFNNLEVHGFSKYKPTFVNFDIDRNMVELNASFERLRLQTDYSIQGRVLILQINGNGRADGNYTNVNVHVLLQGERQVKKGKDYIFFNDIKIDLDLGKVEVYFEDLFRGNPELTHQTNRVINENIDGFVAELKPVAIKTIAKILLNMLGGVFTRYSLDELFPKS